MKRKRQDFSKEWTILIYANGNNDLEPEMYQAKLAAEQGAVNDRVNVIVQLGRESRDLARMMRPLEEIEAEPDSWCGVRRYHLTQTGSILLQEWGNLNMADPNNLADFIRWGIAAYPARKYLLSLGGHGVSFAGIMPDLSQPMPYMLGVLQLGKVLQDIHRQVEKGIDLLMLDICYMNSIEIIYELGREMPPPAKYLVTYMKDGPLGGIPYDKLIQLLQNNGNGLHIRTLLQKICSEIRQNLIAVKLNSRKLAKFKNTLNRMVVYCRSQLPHLQVSKELVYGQAGDAVQLKKYQSKLQSALSRMVIGHDPEIAIAKWRMIEIVDWQMENEPEQIDFAALIYFSFRFSRENRWSHWLVKNAAEKNPSQYYCFKLGNQLKPLLIPRSVFTNWIRAMNPTLNEAEICRIIYDLFIWKKWNFNELDDQLLVEMSGLKTQYRKCSWRPVGCIDRRQFNNWLGRAIKLFQKVKTRLRQLKHFV